MLAGCGDDAPTADDEIVLTSADVNAEEPGIPTNQDARGTKLPDVEISDLSGAKVTTASLIGKPMVINLWYSTCGPCKRELPAFAKISKLFADRVRFVGVNTLDSAETNESFARKLGITYELYGDLDGRLTSAMRISTMPVSLFVAADGTVVEQSGPLEEAKLTELITTKLLAG